jgi:Na+/H+-dicarboxylate symporter
MTFTRQILVGLLLGLAVGLFLGELVAPLTLVAEGFVKLLQMTVLPYVTVSIVSSLGRLGYADATRLGKRAGAVLLSFWAIALAFAFLIPLAFPQTESASFFSTALVTPAESLDLVDLYIPSNPFHSLANNVVPAVVLFSVLLGVATIGLERKEVLLDVLTLAGQAVARATRLVVRLTPFGIFAIAASAAGTLNFDQFQRLQVYLITYMAIALLVSLWVLPGLVAALTPIPYRDVLAPSRDALITAFMAGDLFIVLPVLITACKDLLARHAVVSEESATIPDVLVPTSFNFPHTGKLISLSFILFAGWFSGAPVPLADYPKLALTGVLTFFGSLNAAVPFLLDLFRIPADTFQLFLATGVLNARFGALLAAVHTVALTLIGSAAVAGTLRFEVSRMVRYVVVTLALTAATLGGLRIGFSTVLRQDYKGQEMVYGLHARFAHPPTNVRTDPPPPLSGTTAERIRARGRLEVAVLPRSLPYAFPNQSGDLVGLDVEMAHFLARDLGVDVEFFTTPFEDLPALVRDARCDIAMSGILVTPRRSQVMRFSQPYVDETMAFMVKDYLRGQFATWSSIRSLGGMKVGTLDVPYYISEVHERAPDLQMESIPRDVDPFVSRPDLDAFLVPAERGSVYTLLHPQFAIAVPDPDRVKVPLAYVLPPNDPDWAALVNNWIELKHRDGTLDALFRYWIMGQDPEGAQPRWSVVRNVLHWVK